MRAMDDNGVSPKGVDPSLRCRRKLVIAMAFGTGPNPRCRRKPVSAKAFGRGSGDLQKTLPFITAEDWAWYIIICYYHDSAMRLPKLPVKNDAILIDNADLPTSMSLDSRVAWEAGLMQLRALGRGCVGVMKRSRWALIDIGTNRCCLHMTSACLAEALCVHLPSNIYHGWYTIGDNINVVRSRWRLPFTRSYRVSDTCSMMEVGRQNKFICRSGGSRQRLYSMTAFKLPLIANLDEYDTKGHGNRASLMGEAPCVTVVQYYATEFGHGNSNFTFWPVASRTPSMLSRRTEVPCATATRPDIERVGTWSHDLHDSRGQIESIARQVQLCLDGYRATHTPSGCGDELLFCYVLPEMW